VVERRKKESIIILFTLTESVGKRATEGSYEARGEIRKVTTFRGNLGKKKESDSKHGGCRPRGSIQTGTGVAPKKHQYQRSVKT